MADLCFPFAKMQAKLEKNGHFQAVLKLKNARNYAEMSKLYSIGSLIFAKDSKTVKIFVSTLNCSKNFNFQDFAVIL